MNTLREATYVAVKDNKGHIGTVRGTTDNHFMARLHALCKDHYAEEVTIDFFRIGEGIPSSAIVHGESGLYEVKLEKSCLY